ncbi:unnamed protein product [Polarella glacialis]|uniref:Uncharacterized protein n=1 Tax=Polarella glacialis TaxID=89957 RepID=A0A813EHH6_POLGL|nr:unnamed protein product [Polarella glacialis]
MIKTRGRTCGKAVSGALGCACFPKAAQGWGYAVEGSIEPYRDGPDSLYIQGEFRQNERIFQLYGSYGMQTTQDILHAVIKSDGEWELGSLEDCWSGAYTQEFCCAGEKGGNAGCWSPTLFTYDRCCVKAEDGRFLLQEQPQIAREIASELIPRYDLNEVHWEARRQRWRYGMHASFCSKLPLPADIRAEIVADGGIDLEFAETGLFAAYEVLVRAGRFSRQVLQLGVSDGKSLDPIYPLIKIRGVGGLGLEPDAKAAEKARQNRPSRFRVEDGFATPGNIWSWARQLEDIDVVSVDIDSFDCAVIEALLDGAVAEGRSTQRLPKLLSVEINQIVPPPFKFSRLFSEKFAGGRINQQRASTSCSLSHAVESFGKRGYDLLTFSYDAIFVRRDLGPLFAAARPGLELPQDEFDCYRRSQIQMTSGPIRWVREWFFRADDPHDVHLTLDLLWNNLTRWTAFEGLQALPFSLYL